MTVETTISKAGPYAGAGTVGPFPINFRFLEDSHLRAIKTDASGVSSTISLNTDYSVTGAGTASGGTVMLTVPLPVGWKLTILRDVPATQEADYVENDPFPAESHERALDKLTMLVQQQGEAMGRALIVPPTDVAVSLELPSAAARARRYLSFDLDGRPVATTFDIDTIADLSQQAVIAAGNAKGSEISAASSANRAQELSDKVAMQVEGATPSVVRFSGDGIKTTTFDLGVLPGAEENTQVYVSGVYQQKDTYSVVDNNLVFISAPVSGLENIEVVIAPHVAIAQATAEGVSINDNGLIRSVDSYVKETRADVYVLEGRADDLEQNNAVKFALYAELDAYSGSATAADITNSGIAGRFYRRGSTVANGGTVRKDALGRSWERSYVQGSVFESWFSTPQDAVNEVGSGVVHINSDIAVSKVQLTSGSVVGTGGNVVSTLGANAAFVLGYNRDASGLWRFRSLKDLRINVGAGGTGVEYGDAATASYSGRWSFENIYITGGLVGISKPYGNIGNTYKNVSVRGADYGFSARAQTTGTIMHAGCDHFLGGEFSGNKIAAFFIDSSVAGGGQTTLENVVIENNPGCGVAVFNWRADFGRLMLKSVWFEDNATAASVTIDGVTSAPNDIWLRNSEGVVIDGGNVRKTKVDLNSSLSVTNASFNAETKFEITKGCVVNVDRLFFDSANTSDGVAAYSGIVVHSIADIAGRNYGQYGMALPFAHRRSKTFGVENGTVLAKRSFDGSGSINIGGSTTVNTAQIYGGGAFEYFAQADFSSGGQWFLQTGSAALSSGKWYVYYVKVRRTSGAVPSLIFANTVQLSPELGPYLSGTDWVTIAGAVKYTGASALDASLRLTASGGAVQLQFGATALVEFSQKEDAINFLNSGACVV